MAISVKLASKEQNRLDAIVAATHASNQSEALRNLINEKFDELQANMTLVERRGGHPKHLMTGESNLSERENRKAAITALMTAKVARRAQ